MQSRSRLTRLSVGVVLVAAGVSFQQGRQFEFEPLSFAEQQQLIGQGKNEECALAAQCNSPCMPPGGCTYVGGSFLGYCDCTTEGYDGCGTTGLRSFCTSGPSGYTCNEAAGGTNCGGSLEPNTGAQWMGGVGSCHPSCVPTTTPQEECYNCT